MARLNRSAQPHLRPPIEARNTYGMEATEILALFNGSHVVCNVCHAESTDAYCTRCTELTKKDSGRPYKWTACTECGEHYLGVQTSKKCLRITCNGKREICSIQPAKPAKPKPAKKSRQKIEAA